MTKTLPQSFYRHDPARAITVYPVWAWAIVHGHKPVENRTWATRHRGPLCIHAAAAGTRSRRADAEARRVLAALGVEVPDEVPTGAIVGTVDLIDCVPIDAPGDRQTSFAALATEYSALRTPLATGPICWILADPRPLADPIPARGAQSLWSFRAE